MNDGKERDDDEMLLLLGVYSADAEVNGKMSVRVYDDYKLLNATIENDKYHLPTAQDMFAKLAQNGEKRQRLSQYWT